MLVAADFREKARKALNGNWGVAVGTGFVASLLGAYTAISNGGGGGSSNSEMSDKDAEMVASVFTYEALMIMVMLLGILAIVLLIFGIVQFILGGPITLGYVKFNLHMVNGTTPDFFDLFSQFHRFKEGFLMQLLRGIYIFLWTLCLIVPGIMATFSYAMTPYILYENPGMSANDAIGASKKMMEGNRWRLFCLNISFIGWSFLCIFTLGIGFLWLKPYMEASYAAFYEELKREQFVMSTGGDFAQEENYNDQYSKY